jgi:A/G-specific adenine glycosylase
VHVQQDDDASMSASRKRTTNASRSFQPGLLRWYDHHRRDLPWRRDRDPYRVWVSEIMLQQTRVAAVLEHYTVFLLRFPTVEALAQAPESAVLAAWSGLGYYRRARMLWQAARKVVEKPAAQFPQTAAEWRDLPGIGRYTAAAISSICFGEVAAVVDGNVERVLERLAGKRLSPAELWQGAQAQISPARPGDFNQAMMELGAMVCLPRQPKCAECPLRSFCRTRGELPAAAKVPQQRRETVHYALALRRGEVKLVQRARSQSLMPGMWDLPATLAKGRPWLRLRHSITVTIYDVHVYRVAVRRGRWVETSRLHEIPLTGLARKILRKAGIW